MMKNSEAGSGWKGAVLASGVDPAGQGTDSPEEIGGL